MKRGYSLIEVLVGFLLAFFLLDLLVSAYPFIKLNNNDDLSQDLLSSFMLYEVFNVSNEINVYNDRITFKYLNEERELYFVNNRLIVKPGVVIYFNNVLEHRFYIEGDYIYVFIRRAKYKHDYKIGEL